ncbi:NUDIX hydrolase [Mobilicoccus caccae]|uniref:ADP-ribose pyrophosphatase n=1 Tax=Mobilicoccus caccae TaxID=1859295 RepID=A0ABQ6IST8_9MICO|nr:NUDIX domain-containing protein [Mobilicoccus caccae]GMA41003.1 ADP-ribose pyrophosphatase [Mobilicoccus caccae]
MTTTPAAGTIPWRKHAGRLEVALVHRPKYDDWAWPKGKLDPGEEWTAAAVRETWEETGLRVRLGRPLPTSRYRLARGEKKEVRYWAAEVTGGHGRLENEIDELRWVTPGQARRLLTYDRDLDQLEALTGGPLHTRTVMVVRHALAVPRKQWDGDDDRLRPLNEKGHERSAALVPVFAAYDLTRVVSSPSVRCADTMRPYLEEAGDQVSTTWSTPLSEEGFEEHPHRLAKAVTGGLEGTEPVALCSHGPVLRTLLDRVHTHFRTPGKAVKRTLRATQRENLDKGEALVFHVTVGSKPAIIAVERHRP